MVARESSIEILGLDVRVGTNCDEKSEVREDCSVLWGSLG